MVEEGVTFLRHLNIEGGQEETEARFSTLPSDSAKTYIKYK